MNKEETIKDIQNIINANCWTISEHFASNVANAIYNAGYRKVPDGAVILTPEERDEELKACNEKQAELENEIYALKTNYDCLSEHCTDLENKNVAAENMIDSQAKEIERLKGDNKALEMWNEAYTEENKKLKKQLAHLQTNTAEAIGGIYSGHFSSQEQFAIYVKREIDKIFEPFISKDDNDTEN